MMIGLQYAQIYYIARLQQEKTQVQLDSYITKYAIVKYDAIKQGDIFQSTIENEKLLEGVYKNVPIRSTEKYQVADLKIVSLKDKAFGVQAKYVLRIPFIMFNKKIADIKVPVTLISQFKQK